MIRHLTLLIFLALINSLPWQYRGWLNECTLYFQDLPHNDIKEIFQFCMANRCEEYFLSSCDKMSIVRQTDLAICMPLCCSKYSQYTGYTQLTDFLQQCQRDYFEEANRELDRLNRLPFIIFGVMFGGAAVITIIILLFCYYQNILECIRRRFYQRPDNNQDIELHLFMH